MTNHVTANVKTLHFPLDCPFCLTFSKKIVGFLFLYRVREEIPFFESFLNEEGRKKKCFYEKMDWKRENFRRKPRFLYRKREDD
jgi:C4-type Zn-finger protein